MPRKDHRPRPAQSLVWLVVALVGAAVPSSSEAAEFPAEQLEFFETKVRPMLATHCYQCHSAESDTLQAGIRVDFRDGLLQGGDSGPAIVPGKPEESLLVEAVRYESFEMPPGGQLSDEEIETIERWVAMGAPWPEEAPPVAGKPDEAFDLEARKRTHWAWQPITDPDPPAVTDEAWVRNGIDRFVLAKLEKASLRPAGEADRQALIRRLYFDLTGLPPSPSELATAEAELQAGGYRQLVDRLLDSPHFGERWGRHWLDLVRYAESRGHEFDEDASNAYQYRDYIIRALNADVPYDQLIREHIAGDLLGEPRLHPTSGFNESILGTGFWFLGEWVHSPVDIRKDETDRFDNMIDVMSKTFLGLTVACARCHDHKFDAISSADYYALSGFLQSSDYRQVRFESHRHNRQVAMELAVIDKQFAEEVRPAVADSLLASLDQLLAAEQVAGRPPVTLTSASAKASGPAGTRVLVDYADLSPDEFMQDGVIFGNRRAGALTLDLSSESPGIAVASNDAAVNDPFWQGLESLSQQPTNLRGRLEKLPRSGRTLRTPTFELRDGDVRCRVRGSGHAVACVDSHRLVAGPLHGQTVVRIETESGGRPQWVKLDLRRYVGHRLHLEFTPDQDAVLEVLSVVEGKVSDGHDLAVASTQAVAPSRETLRTALVAWRTAGLAEHPERQQLAAAVRWAVDHTDDWRDAITADGRTVAETLDAWADARRALAEQRKLRSRLAMAMIDGTPENDHLLIRGNSSNPGREIPRRFLEAIDGRPLGGDTSSGRLQLAERIISRDNPLTSRVIVNRVWHHLFGRGIVPTTDDFGVLGQPPTHPALLDHLAGWFDAHGRSIKQTIRYIVTSSAYRMGSQASPVALKDDPKNLLWHHVPPKRLEGEAIRDALLALSGELDRTFYGESIPIYLTDFMDGRGRPAHSGPLDGGRRRSIYTAVRRNFLSPFMLAFDMPVPFSTMGRRNVSNVPAQALILMNDPFVTGRARHFAERSLELGPDDTGSRIDWMIRAAWGRASTERERLLVGKFLRQRAESRGTNRSDLEVWADLAHALVNTKEFLFLR